MKNIIIYTTNDEIVSLKLVDKILSEIEFKKFKFDIIVTNSSFFRKLKVLIVFLFFGSINDLLTRFKNKISLEELLSKHKNCKIVKNVDKKYDFGLNVYGIDKLKTQKFKIYNFHLGSLKNQRGSFIFFYKFLYNWNTIDLTFHETTEKYDVGKILNKRTVSLQINENATKICFLYLENLDFLIESINKIEDNIYIEYKDYNKLNLVPTFFNLLNLIIRIFFRRIFGSL